MFAVASIIDANGDGEISLDEIKDKFKLLTNTPESKDNTSESKDTSA